MNGKTVRTPALLPVVNPHLPVITPDGMHRLGAEALITNAYIFHRSEKFREAALERGLHCVLDFDGVIMTDSGSYQLSVYGDVEVTNRDTLAFQHAIGSDIIVPLDIPTSPNADRATVERDLATTLDRLREARDLYPESNLAGPVQGGIFLDLREAAAAEVQSLGFSFCPIGAVVPLMEAYRYQDLVEVVLAAKRGLSPASCVHLFGAGHPAMFALAVAMGCDLFDSAAYALYAKEGRYITPQGSKKLEELADFPCACEVCRRYTPDEVLSAPNREELLARHNLIVTLAECSIVRQALRDGVLWELVDDRCRSHPRLLAGYRQLLVHGSELEASDRISKRRFFYRGSESCGRSEVTLHAERLARLTLGARVLVVIDGERLPGYDDVLLFKPPFGPYPHALSETFPVGQSEVPPWDDEMMRTGCRAIRTLAETHPESLIAISCTPRWSAIVRDTLPDLEVIG